MHHADAGAHEGAAQDQVGARGPRLADDVEHDRAGEHRRGHRREGDPDVVVDSHRQSKRQHADEMHRPDADAHRHRPGRQPRSLGETRFGRADPSGEPEHGIRRERRDDDRESDQRRVVRLGQRESRIETLVEEDQVVVK